MKITHRLALVLAALTFFATTASSASECADHLTTKGAARTIDLTTEEAVGDNGPYADCIVDTAVFQWRILRFSKTVQRMFFHEELRPHEVRATSLLSSRRMPDASSQRVLIVQCILFLRFEGVEEWCYRKDQATISWCEGNPPKVRCRDEACRLGSDCSCGAVKARFRQ